jgi:hypothetical protein
MEQFNGVHIQTEAGENIDVQSVDERATEALSPTPSAERYRHAGQGCAGGVSLFGSKTVFFQWIGPSGYKDVRHLPSSGLLRDKRNQAGSCPCGGEFYNLDHQVAQAGTDYQ